MRVLCQPQPATWRVRASLDRGIAASSADKFAVLPLSNFTPLRKSELQVSGSVCFQWVASAKRKGAADHDSIKGVRPLYKMLAVSARTAALTRIDSQ
jgi:hypothetical protein